LLIQTITADRPYGFRTNQPGNQEGRITDMGGYPLNVINIDATVSFHDDRFNNAKVVALNENGYATDQKVNTSNTEKTSLQIELTKDSVYHIVMPESKTKMSEWQQDNEDAQAAF